MSGQTLMRVDAQVTPPETTTEDRVRFEGVAITPGLYQAEGDVQIRITEAHLEAIADRMQHVQIRDLHEETIEATVGQVAQAHVVEDAVTFVGEVARDPHATIVREFPDSIRFSLGFRFAREDLDVEDGVADLPSDFFIDHLAIVSRGQDPDARLTKLLNRAKPGASPTDTGDDPGDGITVDEDTLDELRRQRDEALDAKEQARADLADARTRLETKDERIEELELEIEQAQEDLEAAEDETSQARAELSRAREHFADSILKLELQAGADLDLTERREELLDLDLGELDTKRLELAEQVAEGEASEPATKAADTSAGSSADETLDLSELSVEESVKLGLMKEAI